MNVIAQSSFTSLPSARARRRMRSQFGEPLFIAAWIDALMIHFEVDAAALQRDVPFELDLWNGRAFVSLVAFTMRDMRPRVGGKWAALLFRPIATHHFLNARTYVRHGDECGIHFLAEWLTNRLAVMLGPATFGLPYRYGRISYCRDLENARFVGRVADANKSTALTFEARIGKHSHEHEPSPHPDPLPSHPMGAEREQQSAGACNSEASRRSPGSGVQCANFSGKPPKGRWQEQRTQGTQENYRQMVCHDGQIDRFTKSIAFQPCVAGSLDEWLMERYIAFNSANGNRRFFRVWHPPWPQCSAEAIVGEKSLLTNIWPWFAEARMTSANFSPGFDTVWMGRPCSVSTL